MTHVLEIIERFGFPVAVVLWFLWRTDRRLDRLLEGVVRLTSMVQMLADLKCRPAAEVQEERSSDDQHSR